MLSSFRQQVYYSFIGLLILAALPWLLFLIYSPADIIKLGEIGYFEGGKFLHFPVKHLSKEIFQVVLWSYPAIVGVFLALSIAFFKTELLRFPEQIKRLLYKIRNFVNREISSLTRSEKLLVGITFLLLILERSYYLLQYPIHTDEAATYLMFIRNGPFAIAAFYPIPNNHLLQNLLAWPLTFFFSEPFWVLRLPPLIFSLLLSFSGFLILKRFSGFLTAYLATALFSFGSLTLFLSTQGRGYILLTLLAIMTLAFLFRALQTFKIGYWVGFSSISALGFFTVLTFAYPFAVCCTYAALYLLLKQQWRQLPHLLLALIFTLISASILYAPLLLVSGTEALLQNKYLLPLTPDQFSEKLPVYLKEVQGELLGGKFGNGIWCFYISNGFLLLLFLFLKRPFFRKLLPEKNCWLIGFVLLMSVLVFALLRYQLLLPPPRVMFFKSFFDYTGLAIGLSFLLQVIFRNLKLGLIWAFTGVLIFAGFQITAAEAFLKDYPQPYYTSPALNKLIRESGAQRVYIEEAFYQLFLEYEYARFNKNIRIENEVKAPAQLYDFVVLEHQKPFPEAIPDTLYKQVYQDELVKAFRPKKAMLK